MVIRMQRMSFLVCLILAVPAWSGLGDRVVLPQGVSTEGAHSKLNATVPYIVNERSYHSIQIKEYVRNDGIVFAVTWSGIGHPDMQEILGSFHGSYESSQSRLKLSRHTRSFAIKEADLVVKRFGHLRNLRGQAYVPSLLPSGFDLGELQ